LPSATSSAIAPTVSDLGVLRRAVHVVQVDHLDAEPQQRLLAGLLDEVMLTAEHAVPLAAGAVDAELGGQLHLVAMAHQGPADQDLVVSLAVEVRGVQERHAQLECAVDGGDRLVPVARAVGLAHPHAAQALGRHGQVAECGGAHVLTTPVQGWSSLLRASAAAQGRPGGGIGVAGRRRRALSRGGARRRAPAYELEMALTQTGGLP
jgi:hypothetical protein